MGSATEVEARKRKRFNKNKKKNWRKANVDDIEEFLEDQRLQERTGGLVAEKTDDALFFVDTSANEVKKIEPASRKRKVCKPLRCHALLEPDPNIKPVKVPYPGRKAPISRKRKTKQEHLNQLNNIQNKKQKCDDTELPVVQVDLWSNDAKEEEVDEYYMRQTKKKMPQPPRHLKEKPSVLPSVEVPHPGASYNPLYDEYQDLLRKALEVEKQKEKEEQKLKRAVDDLISKVTVKELKENWMKEMSSGINDDDLSDDSEDVGNGDNDRLSVNPPVRREDKKTEKQRRKQKEKQAKEKLAAVEKANKLRSREIFRLKRLKLEVEQRLLALKKRQELKAAKNEEKTKQPKKLGKYKYEEPETEIKLSDELPDCLRHLKPEGHLLEDRMKSLQKRNIIEPRKRVKVSRRYKRKTYIKKSHKAAVNLIRNA